MAIELPLDNISASEDSTRLAILEKAKKLSSVMKLDPKYVETRTYPAEYNGQGVEVMVEGTLNNFSVRVQPLNPRRINGTILSVDGLHQAGFRFDNNLGSVEKMNKGESVVICNVVGESGQIIPSVFGNELRYSLLTGRSVKTVEHVKSDPIDGIDPLENGRRVLKILEQALLRADSS